jgi:hypothetical protein
MPQRFHGVEVLGNHAAQLVAPFLLFTPQPVAGAGAAIMIVTQLWLVASGNFSWLNWTTIVLAASALDGAWLHAIVRLSPPSPLGTGPIWWVAIVIAVSGSIVALSWWPARNMASRRQLMNASFTSLRLVNTYGAFGSMTRVRDEVVVEGTEGEPSEGASWLEYEFKGKPTDPRRRPPQVAPYHLRLDWLMWFAALDPGYAQGWFMPFLAKLLEADAATLKLLRRDPFAGTRPRYVRALLYRYRFTTRAERRSTGAIWERSLIGEYVSPVALHSR